MTCSAFFYFNRLLFPKYNLVLLWLGKCCLFTLTFENILSFICYCKLNGLRYSKTILDVNTKLYLLIERPSNIPNFVTDSSLDFRLQIEDQGSCRKIVLFDIDKCDSSFRRFTQPRAELDLIFICSFWLYCKYFFSEQSEILISRVFSFICNCSWRRIRKLNYSNYFLAEDTFKHYSFFLRSIKR